MQTAPWEQNPLCQVAKLNDFYWTRYMRCKDYCAWQPVRVGSAAEGRTGGAAPAAAGSRPSLLPPSDAVHPAALLQWNGALGAEVSVTVLVVRMGWSWDWLESPVPGCGPL